MSKETWEDSLEGDWFNLISVIVDPLTNDISMDPEYPGMVGIRSISCPKQLMSMSKEKAIGSMKWWRKVMASKYYPCFIYCPDEMSIFTDDGLYNLKVIKKLISDQGGRLDYMELKFPKCVKEVTEEKL